VISSIAKLERIKVCLGDQPQEKLELSGAVDKIGTKTMQRICSEESTFPPSSWRRQGLVVGDANIKKLLKTVPYGTLQSLGCDQVPRVDSFFFFFFFFFFFLRTILNGDQIIGWLAMLSCTSLRTSTSCGAIRE